MQMKEIRKRCNLKQRQVANALYIPLRTYQNYERGINSPDIAMLASIADLYHVSIDELVGHESPMGSDPYSLTETERDLICLFRRMPQVAQQDLVETLSKTYDIEEDAPSG